MVDFFPYYNGAKGLCARGSQKAKLTAGVRSRVRIYYRAPSKGVGDKPQIHSNLVFELGVFCLFFKGEDQRDWD